MLKKINYVSSVCGSGKTHAAIKYISENQFQEKFLITVPTIKLSAQITKDLSNLGVQNVFEVNCEITKKQNVKEAAKKVFHEINELTYGVAIITNPNFENLPEYIRKSLTGFVHILDEPPKLIEAVDINLPYSHKTLTDLLKVVPSNIFENISDVFSNNTNLIEKYIQRSSDVLNDHIKLLLKKIISPHYMVVADTENWEKIVVNGNISPDVIFGENKQTFGNAKNKITFISILKPSIEKYFSKTIYLGANFENSMMFQFWQDNFNVQFTVAEEIQKNLRLTEHTNGDLLNIYYGQKNNYSRYQSRLIDKESGLNGAQIHFQIAKEILDPNKKVLTLCNLDDEKYAFDAWNKVSSVPHGLNEFQDYNQFCFTGAYNFSPRTYKLLEYLNINKDAIFHDMTINRAYQGLLRTSLRNPDSLEPVSCYVPNEIIANEIGKMFIGANLISINGDKEKVVGKEALGDSATRILRLKKGLMNAHYVLDKLQDTNYGEIVFDSEQELPILLNHYKNMYSKGETELTYFSDFAKTAEKFFHYNITKNKEDNVLFNFSEYNDETRQLEAVLGSTAVIFDFDKGELTPEEFNKIFHDELKLSYISYSTTSNGTDGIRFRAIFPINMFMDKFVYSEVYTHITKLLEKYNYFTIPLGKNPQKYLKLIKRKNPLAKNSGIDLSKFNLSSIFFAPAILESNKKNAFFFKSYTNKKEIVKHTFNGLSITSDKIIELEELVNSKTGPTQIVKQLLPSEAINIEVLKNRTSNFFNNKKTNNDLKKQKIVNRIENEMVAHNRSSLAVSIAGSIKYFDISDKLDIINLMVAKGCSKSAIKSVHKYANLN